MSAEPPSSFPPSAPDAHPDADSSSVRGIPFPARPRRHGQLSTACAKGPVSGPAPLPAAAHLPGINSSAESLIAWPRSQPLAHPGRDWPSSKSNPGQSRPLSQALPKPSRFSLALCAKAVPGSPCHPPKSVEEQGEQWHIPRGRCSAQHTQPVLGTGTRESAAGARS